MTDSRNYRHVYALVAWIAVSLAAGFILSRPSDSVFGRYWFGWYAVAYAAMAALARRHQRLARALPLIAIAVALMVALRNAFPVIDGTDRFSLAYVLGAAGVAGISVFQLAGRRLDPLVFVAVVLGIALVTDWTYSGASGSGLNPDLYHPHTLASPLRSELPLLFVALASAGLWLTRTPTEVARRLGLARPSPLAVGLAAAVGMFSVAAQPLVNYMTYLVTPDALYAIDAVETKVTATDTIAIVLIWTLLAGVSEELLFRGALQPRSGLLVAALLFAMIHVQYGVTPILGWVFLGGLAFGALRMLYDTTTAIIAHVSTGFFASMSLYLREPWNWALTFGLVLVLIGWIWYSDRKVKSEAEPGPARPM